ncbi:hypothetical protein FACS1894172_09560 [Spirochaetia bacterium]|nr:hypothetical protein FACS1894172_09560 [Spirochaetia bacterium]
MQQYIEQINRMKLKLKLAKNADRNLKVFGADSHRYTVNPPLSPKEITMFETQYGIQLPDCYKAFVTLFGNGGVSYQNSAAGPFYGIFPFGKELNCLSDNPQKSLKLDCRIYPGMTDEYWKEFSKTIEEDDISDEEYEELRDTIFGGLLPIGAQGCEYSHAIVLNGQYAGKVVNMSEEFQKPHFSFEDTFLDWYERWLDEIISGDLLQEGPYWFGYSMGGAEETLLNKFLSTDNERLKLDCVAGILDKKAIHKPVLEEIEKEYANNTGEVKNGLVEILTKFDYKRAKPYLLELADTDLLNVCQFIWWYAKDRCREWAAFIKTNLARIDDVKTFRFCAYILEKAGQEDAETIIPFTKHRDKQIRQVAYHRLGELKHKSHYLDIFINGLQDPEHWVVHATLQALDGLKDTRLLPYYKQIAERFPVEQDYILINLNHRLKEYGLDNISVQELGSTN